MLNYHVVFKKYFLYISILAPSEKDVYIEKKSPYISLLYFINLQIIYKSSYVNYRYLTNTIIKLLTDIIRLLYRYYCTNQLDHCQVYRKHFFHNFLKFMKWTLKCPLHNFKKIWKKCFLGWNSINDELYFWTCSSVILQNLQNTSDTYWNNMIIFKLYTQTICLQDSLQHKHFFTHILLLSVFRVNLFKKEFFNSCFSLDNI